MPRLLEGERLGQRHDAGLGDVVLPHAGARIDRVGGRDVDDAAAPAGAQVADRGTDERRVAQQVDGEHALPGLAPRVGERLVGADAREIDQHVDRAERLAGGRDGRIGGFLAPDIGGDALDLRARDRGADLRERRVHRGGIAVDQHDARALLAEQEAGRGADPPCSAGDDRDLVGQPSRHAFLPVRCAIVYA